jgi:predicted flap endonuclease-1-like 5' DNA nuclease/predicted  nucleic acid-binding Zn-ribbon protein
MSGLDFQTILYLLVAAVLGGIVGGLIRSKQGGRSLGQLGDKWQTRFDGAVRQKEKLSAENASLKSSLEANQAVVEKHKHAATTSRTELESLREKSNAVSKKLFALSAERDELNSKLSGDQGSLNAANQRVAELKTEFVKAGTFYKAQLKSAFDQRKALERKIDDAKLDHESLSNQLMSARSEHESVNKLLASAQSRLENMEALEKKVISLDADNAQLKHEAILAARETQSLKRDVAEMDALRAQNTELAQCLQSVESSRKQYEVDARRYRSQYDESEQESDTLRLKLGDIEKNFAEMQHDHDNARVAVKKHAAASPAIGKPVPKGERDNLQEIIGVGKIFEATLHKLGIYQFRQIAAFEPADLARVNAELKEFKGRIEHDDWIGQAKELHFKKYGGTDEE